METVYQALGITLIIAIAVVIIAMMFRDSIRKRIESGASFESSFGPTGAKLLLGPSDKEAPALPSAAQPQQVSEPLLTDAKLIKLIPPLDPKRFKTITLPAHQPPPVYKLPDAPTGLFMLNQIPFFLQPVVDAARNLIGHQVIDIAPGHGNAATVEEVPANVQDVTAVHFLLSAGNGHVTWEGVQFLGKQIGHVELLFADNTTQRVNLLLGKHIREWAFENFPGLVRDIDPALTQPAWVSYDNAHRIDYMPVSVGGGPKTLKHIRVVAQFEDKHLEKPIALPAIIISAITCERKA
jgi:hypothetical protein